MSFDYSVVVRGRKRKPERIRELAASLLVTHEARFVDSDSNEDDEDDDDDLDISVAAPRPALAATTLISLEDCDGAVLRDGRVDLGAFQRLIQQGGMLLDSNPPLHPMLTEDGRYGLGGRVLVAMLHDSDGAAFRRYRWTLDGYGRISSIDVDEL